MFSKHDDSACSNPLPGIRMRTLCHGDRTLMTEFVLQARSDLPLHSHPFEQTGYLVSGHIKLRVDGREYDVLPGDSWCIAADAEHGAQSIDDSVAVEVFSPVREDYLPSRPAAKS